MSRRSYHCHECQQNVQITVPADISPSLVLKCTNCSSEFVEEIRPNDNPGPEALSQSYDVVMGFLQTLLDENPRAPRLQTFERSVRVDSGRRRIPRSGIDRVFRPRMSMLGTFLQDRSDVTFGSETNSSVEENEELHDDDEHEGPLNRILQMFGIPQSANFGDYAFGQQQLDQIITQLMEQQYGKTNLEINKYLLEYRKKLFSSYRQFKYQKNMNA